MTTFLGSCCAGAVLNAVLSHKTGRDETNRSRQTASHLHNKTHLIGLASRWAEFLYRAPIGSSGAFSDSPPSRIAARSISFCVAPIKDLAAEV
jgi:hypothetical protein